jgi:hypothetical protein
MHRTLCVLVVVLIAPAVKAFKTLIHAREWLVSHAEPEF